MTSIGLFNFAVAGKLDTWVPACGGTEEVFTKNGVRYLYCFNPGTQQHAYLNVDTDVMLTDEEAISVFV